MDKTEIEDTELVKAAKIICNRARFSWCQEHLEEHSKILIKSISFENIFRLKDFVLENSWETNAYCLKEVLDGKFDILEKEEQTEKDIETEKLDQIKNHWKYKLDDLENKFGTRNEESDYY